MVEKNVRFRSNVPNRHHQKAIIKKSTRRHRRYDSLGGQDANHSSTDDMMGCEGQTKWFKETNILKHRKIYA